MQAIEISRTGMDVEWRRLEVIAQNLANANTTRTPTGGPYRAMRLVSGPRADFARILREGGDATTLSGVEVYGVEPIDLPPRRVYDPTHPHADTDGYVSYPAFDHAGEMTLMVKTARAYEANVVAMGAAREMYAKALELGKNG